MMKGKTLVWATLFLPALAPAQEGGGLPTGQADLYMVPKANLELRDGGTSADIGGDGYGVKALFHVTDLIKATGEYQTVSYDAGDSDRSDLRLGAGLANAVGTGVFAEYLSIENGDGFAVYGRAAGSFGIPRLGLHGQAGYVQVEDDERAYGFEFSLGASYALFDVAGGTLGAMIDYRLTNLEGQESNVEVKLRDLRVGARFLFGGESSIPDTPEEEVAVEPVVEETPADAPAEEAVGVEPAAEEPTPTEEAPAEEAPAEEAPAQ
jgi:hypothetical protein